jgi:hypothetical protein
VVNHPLLSSYATRYSDFEALKPLTFDSLGSSISLFSRQSLIQRQPDPISLDVVCIVAGLPLSELLTIFIKDIKARLSAQLVNSLHYLVEDHNHAIELAVLKWPNDPFNSPLIDDVNSFFLDHHFFPISCSCVGLQIHTDGCMLLKCIDHDSSFTSLRSILLASVPSLPLKQSAWVHIPLGRILEPISPRQQSSLVSLCNSTSKYSAFPFMIDELKLVHEKKWYQCNSEVLSRYSLSYE